MVEYTKEDVIQWKASAVTRAFMQAAYDNLRNLEEHLGGAAGENSLQDRFHCGYIAALKDYIEFKFDVEFQEEKKDE